LNKLETRSTSANTAECSPIVLRETDRVRLVFLPTLVTNPGAPEASVRGRFVYERKAKGGEWTRAATISLSRLKVGEGVTLELHSQELLNFVRGIASLYRLYRQQGIPAGRSTFVRLEAGLARFLELSEPDLTRFLETHKDDAAKTLAKLVSWASLSSEGGAAAVIRGSHRNRRD
jgi:Shedu protein SduA, N-terminal